MAKSMFSLSDFKATIKSNGVAKDTRFEVIFYPPQELQLDSKEISIRCHTASMPAFNVKTRDYIVGQGQIRKMPVNFDNGNTIELSFYNNYKGMVYADLVKWAKMVSPNISENDHTINFVSGIYGKIVVQQLDEQDNVRQGWELREAYPTNIDAVNLDSGHIDNVQVIKVHIAYRYAMTLKEVSDLESNPLSPAVFNDMNSPYGSKMRANNVLSTAKGNYAKRSRKYTTNDVDPTMVNIVSKTDKGSGLTPDEYYAYLTEYVMTTRAKGSGIYTEDQLLWMSEDVDAMNSAIATNDMTIISATFTSFTLSYNNVRGKADDFFGDASSCVGSYNSIKDTLPENDPLTNEVSNLKSTYNTVFDTQLKIDSTYKDISDTVNSINNTITVSVV